METIHILIILLATALGFAYLLKIRSLDIYEKEPLGKLIIVSIAGGILSILISLGLYLFVDVKHNIIDAIFKIGLIEEIAKFLTLIILFPFIKKEFDEIVDGIIYISAIALGFAVIENMFYAIPSENPFYVLLLRNMTSVIGHISFAGYMGIAFFIHKRIHTNYIGIVFSIFIAALAHGLYDGFLFHKELTPFFITILWILYYLQYRLFKTVMGFSNFKRIVSDDLFSPSDISKLHYCVNCQKEFKAEQLSFTGITASICESCGYYSFNQKELLRLLKYSRPVLWRPNKFMKSLPNTSKRVGLENRSILFDVNKKATSAKINTFGIWLEKKNRTDKIDLLNHKWIGFIYKIIGLKHLVERDHLE